MKNSHEAYKDKTSYENAKAGHTNFIPPSTTGSPEIKSIQLKLIKLAQLELQTQNMDQAKGFLDQVLNKYQGYYSNESFHKSSYEAAYDLSIRVPAEKFSSLLNQMGNGPVKLISKNVETKDVTEDYADTETRIVSKRTYLKRYQELLGKAKNVTELLQME